MRNYFRIQGTDRCIFFDDESRTDTTRAHEAARATGAPFVLFRPSPLLGPWNGAPLAGHRAKHEIESDIHDAALNNRFDDLVERAGELAALTSRFFEVGGARVAVH